MSLKKRTCKVCGQKMRSKKRLFEDHQSKCTKSYVENVLMWLKKEPLKK